MKTLFVENENQQLVGSLSQGDIVSIFRSRPDELGKPLKHLMNLNPAYQYSKEIGKLKLLFQSHQISHIPIIDKNGRILEVVSVFDVI